MEASLFRLGDIRKIALFQEAYSGIEGSLFDFFEGEGDGTRGCEAGDVAGGARARDHARP